MVTVIVVVAVACSGGGVVQLVLFTVGDHCHVFVTSLRYVIKWGDQQHYECLHSELLE